MQFSTLLVATFAALTIAAPSELKSKRANVFANTTYNAISISGGVAGNALKEADAVLSNNGAIDLKNLATLSHDDIEFLDAVNKVGNLAERQVYNLALNTTTDAAAHTALQNGKIKNKVLKLEASVIKLNAQIAQGKNVTAKLAIQTKKLNHNVGLDTAAAGQPSTKLDFTASIP